MATKSTHSKTIKPIKLFASAKIIAVYNQKGGCGKTTMSIQLGGALAHRGYKVLIIDMDPQATASLWSGQAPEDRPFPATVVSLSSLKEKMIKEVEKFSENYHFIVIDCPPAIESSVPWAALNIADLGLIPIQPFMDNIWASVEAKKIGLRAQQENPGLKLRYVPSIVRRSALTDECLSLLKEDQEIQMLEFGLAQRNAYPLSQVWGATVMSSPKKTKAAIEDLEAMTSAVLKTLSIKG